MAGDTDERDGQPMAGPAEKTTATGGGRRAQGASTKQTILDAAIDLYAERGFRGTGLMAIGERAGVAHATVLYHFGSSHDLLMAVLAERDRLFQEATRDDWVEPGLGALRHLPEVARFHVAEPKLGKLFAVLQAENLDPDHDANEYFRTRRREIRDLLRAQLGRAVEQGEVRADIDIDITADHILSFTTGAQIQYFLAPDDVDLVALYESFTATLIRDLTRADP